MNYNALAGHCNKCNEFFDWPRCYEMIGGRWTGAALNRHGICKACDTKAEDKLEQQGERLMEMVEVI